MVKRVGAVICLILANVAPAIARTDAQTLPPTEVPDARRSSLRSKLESSIDDVDKRFDGVLGVGILDLTSGETILRQGDTEFPIASSIKIAVLAEVLRQSRTGSVNLDTTYTLAAGDIVGGDGNLQHLTPGSTRLTLRDLATLMITESDNTATNVLIDRFGIKNVNDLLQKIGLQKTRLRRKMMDARAAAEGRENISTPREMLALLEWIHRDGETGPALLEMLSLPKKRYLDFPDDVRAAHKSGTLDGVRTDSGIIFVAGRPFAITVMTTWARDEKRAEEAIREIAIAAFAYFDRLARSSEYGRRLQ
jgi:beta-lactamase class A